MSRRQIQLLIAAALLVVTVAGAILYFSGKKYVYRFTEAELQTKLDEQLPFTETYLFIFQVTLESPRVNLVEGSDRVKAGVDLLLNIYINNEPLPLGGSIDFSGSVNYLAKEGEFYLVDPVIERLDVQGVPTAYAERVKTILTSALSNFYSTRPIYALRGGAPNKMAARLLLREVMVKDKVLVVTLGLQ